MSKITLVTGGSRSGKSNFAERLFSDTDDVLYMATAIVTDQEMEDRIKLHKERRNPLWTTFEGYKDLNKVIEFSNSNNVLLDCVTIMITNLMFDEERNFNEMKKLEIDQLLSLIKKEFSDIILAARANNKNLILVTNEVGCGLIPEYKLSRIFRDIAGSVNQLLASLSDEVYLITCGLPSKLK
jgi:adenosylcobinamide kinase / adenosylcobinamide-phosphate guanylyltransferase